MSSKLPTGRHILLLRPICRLRLPRISDFSIKQEGKTGDGLVTLQSGFVALWTDIKGICTKYSHKTTPGLSASCLGSVVARRITGTIPEDALRFAFLTVVDSHTDLKESLDLYHLAHMLGYGGRNALNGKASYPDG